MSQMRICISGKKGSGKDALANLIVAKLLKECRTIQTASFAHPIKEVIRLVFPTASAMNLYGPSHLREEPIPGVLRNGKVLTYRQALLDVGSDIFGTAYIPDIWLNVMRAKFESAKEDVFIITDARFKTEMQLAKDNGFFMVRIVRPSNGTSKHASETEMDDVPNDLYDLIIENDGDLDDLETKVQSATFNPAKTPTLPPKSTVKPIPT